MLEKLGLNADEVVGFEGTEDDTGGFYNLLPNEFEVELKMVEEP